MTSTKEWLNKKPSDTSYVQVNNEVDLDGDLDLFLEISNGEDILRYGDIISSKKCAEEHLRALDKIIVALQGCKNDIKECFDL